MKRLGLVLVALLSVAACGGGDKAEPDLSACGPVTCSATMYYSSKTCSCVIADLAMTGAPMDMSMPGD
jgi:hypothetical protein